MKKEIQISKNKIISLLKMSLFSLLISFIILFGITITGTLKVNNSTMFDDSRRITYFGLLADSEHGYFGDGALYEDMNIKHRIKNKIKYDWSNYSPGMISRVSTFYPDSTFSISDNSFLDNEYNINEIKFKHKLLVFYIPLIFFDNFWLFILFAIFILIAYRLFIFLKKTYSIKIT